MSGRSWRAALSMVWPCRAAAGPTWPHHAGVGSAWRPGDPLYPGWHQSVATRRALLHIDSEDRWTFHPWTFHADQAEPAPWPWLSPHAR